MMRLPGGNRFRFQRRASVIAAAALLAAGSGVSIASAAPSSGSPLWATGPIGRADVDKSCAVDDRCTGNDRNRDGHYDAVGERSKRSGHKSRSGKTTRTTTTGAQPTATTAAPDADADSPTTMKPPTTSKPTTSVPATTAPKPTSTTAAPKPSSGNGGDLHSNATLQLRAAQITSTFENSTTELQYGYAEDIGDGNGITAGRAGFCSGTADLLQLVQQYTAKYPSNGLAKFLPALKSVNGSSSHAGLSGFEAAFAAEAKKAEFRKAQDDLVNELYLQPALKAADGAGITTPLGQAIFWDTNIQHGMGGVEGLSSIVKETTQKMGGGVKGNEAAWLKTFLDVRLAKMYAMYPDMKDGKESSDSRVNALRSLVASGNFAMNPPMSWVAYGETFRIS